MLALTEKQFLIKALGQFVCDEVQLAVKPLHDKMKNIEGAFETHRAACTEVISAKRDEIDKLLAVHTQAVDSALDDVIKNLPQPKDGKDGKDGRDGIDAVIDYERIQKFIKIEIDALPKPQDGKDGRDGIDGKDGINYDKDFMIAEIYGAINKAFEDNPPKDGKDGKDGRDGADGENLSLDDVRDCLNDLVVKAIAGIPVPRHCTGGYINRDGHLFLAFSDGAHSDLGPVVGEDGKDCDMEIIRTQVTAYLATIEKPKDGKDGKDGRDGVGFDDLVLDYDGERALTFQFIREDGLVKSWEFTLPIPLVRDVYKQGNYKRGDIVIRGGSMYVAGKDTATMPGIGDSDWKLCTKAGRDGKPGAAGPPGPPGKDGQNGRDLTQLGPDGGKW